MDSYWRLKQKNGELEANLDYIGRPCRKGNKCPLNVQNDLLPPTPLPPP